MKKQKKSNLEKLNSKKQFILPRDNTKKLKGGYGGILLVEEEIY